MLGRGRHGIHFEGDTHRVPVGGTKKGIYESRFLFMALVVQVRCCGEAGTGSIAKVAFIVHRRDWGEDISWSSPLGGSE